MENTPEPTIRDDAIEAACSNMIMAGIVMPTDAPFFMAELKTYDDGLLAKVLCGSRILLDLHLEKDWNLN